MSVVNETDDAVDSGSGVDAAAEMSFYQRVRMTPWGDLLRLKLSGRFDVEGRIAQSGLPTENRILVRNVMKRVRLWRGERVEVVEELLVHFQDGIGAGTGAAELAKSFGEVKQAATLIRRSKKRQRPRSWMMFTRLLKGFGLLVACGFVWYCGALLYYFSGEVVVGEDYVAELTAKARSVPAEDRAWPVYRDALVTMQGDFRLIGELGGEPWSRHGERWPETVAFLEKYESELVALRRAAGMTGLGYVADNSIHAEDAALWPDEAGVVNEAKDDWFEKTLLNVRLPHLAVIRNAARPLSADAYLAATRGDGGRAVADIRALLGLGVQLRETPTLISDLVSVSVMSMTFTTLADILSENAAVFSTDELRALAHEIGALEEGAQGVLAVRLNSERCMMYDLFQRIYTDDGKGGGHLSPAGLRGLGSLADMTSSGGATDGLQKLWDFSDAFIPAAGLVIANRREMRTEYDFWMDRIVAEASLPLWERPLNGVEAEFEMKAGETLWMAKYTLLWSLMPAISRAGMQEHKILMRRDGVLTALALELWQREHDGAWPEDLAMLVPQYLPTFPIDRFTGGKLGYLVRDDDSGVVVYGVGVDLDDDDGFEPNENVAVSYKVMNWMHPEQVATMKAEDERMRASSSVSRRLADGDWILWESGGGGE